MSQYLGDISAYALAVSQGYTGTEEEYAELMASYATVGQTAVTAAQTATSKASEAATSATTATNKASEATTAAQTATSKAAEASTSASTATSAKDTAMSASQTATTKAGEATTAAATAVSAKDDAVSANTAAQSAKTAAQTAQTGAETAAASVAESAAQIQTNAEDISQLKSDLNTITGVERITYTVGRYVQTTNPLTMVDGKPVTTGDSNAWKSAIIACSEGDVFTINGASNNANLRAWRFSKADGYYISESANPSSLSDLVLVAPANSAWLVLNSNDLDCVSYIGKAIPQKIVEIENDISNKSAVSDYNDSLLFNNVSSKVAPIEITDVDFVNLQIDNGGVVNNSTQRKSAVCRIVPNTYIRITKIQTKFAWIGFSTEYPTAGTVLNRQDEKNGVVNTEIGLQAGENDHYMIFMYYDSSSDSSATDIEESMHIYYDCADYSQFDMIAHADSKLINLLKYRPVGRVQKPYIAISCDDGNAVLATYTIPRIKEWKQTYGKNIPVTFALFNTSDVMVNTTYKALTIDACENDGCAIAIHGVHSFFNYTTRKQLMDYIQAQDDFLYAETGIKPNAVIYPEHDYNDFIQTYCGSFYNACGCGGNTHNLAYEDASGRPFYIGEKSNCYEIYRLAIHDTRITSLEDVEAIVDYAYDHNYIICPYFHDVDLGDSAPNKDFLRSVLDKFVSYGVSKGIDFIKLGDIPNVL